MQNAFEIWRYHSLMLHARDIFCQTWLQSADQTANKYNACCCSSRSWTASIFPSFNTLLQSILFSNLSRLVSNAKQVMLNSPEPSLKRDVLTNWYSGCFSLLLYFTCSEHLPFGWPSWSPKQLIITWPEARQWLVCRNDTPTAAVSFVSITCNHIQYTCSWRYEIQGGPKKSKPLYSCPYLC